jgi:hypothetical protein
MCPPAEQKQPFALQRGIWVVGYKARITVLGIDTGHEKAKDLEDIVRL